MCGTIVPRGHGGLPCGAVGLRAYVDLSMSCCVHLLTKNFRFGKSQGLKRAKYWFEDELGRCRSTEPR
jgi:hypothetical protein